MKLSEILTGERVVAALTVSSKKKALEELANLLTRGDVQLTSAEVFTSLTSREKLGSTGLGHGVAIPHGRVTGIDTALGAFVRLKHPVDYDAHDGNPVDLLFGLVVPKSATDSHLKHLAAVAAMFSDEVFCRKLREAPDERALAALLTAYASEN